MSMYIRLKRKNQTIFLHVEPSNTFLQIKQRIGENLNMEPSNIMLLASDKVRLFYFALWYNRIIDHLPKSSLLPLYRRENW
jgi:hypothetical protein